ncbi:MAG TPA: cobalamin-dependent protein [Baekduia sp.]|jgi:methylmalonyl-CoA mutase C-terminal domain/subunit
MRILLAKPGLDGHDRGIHVLGRALRDAGHEVIVTGRFWSPAAIARAAVEEDVGIVGLSILAGGHLGLTADALAALHDLGAECDVIVGGTIPDGDVDQLLALGCRGVFPVGSRLDEIVAWIAEIEREDMAA